jgi:hypothetical protein
MENFLNRIIDAVNGRNLLDALYDALHTEGMNDFLGGFLSTVLIIAILLALVNCFLGYKALKPWSAIESAMAGGVAAYFTAAAMSAQMPVATWEETALIAASIVVFGVVGFFITRVQFAVRVFVFMTAFIGIIMAGIGLAGTGFIIAVIVALIFAITAAVFIRMGAYIYTSLSGAIVTAAALSVLLTPMRKTGAAVIIIVLLTAAGIFLQMFTNGGISIERHGKHEPPIMKDPVSRATVGNDDSNTVHPYVPDFGSNQEEDIFRTDVTGGQNAGSQADAGNASQAPEAYQKLMNRNMRSQDSSKYVYQTYGNAHGPEETAGATGAMQFNANAGQGASKVINIADVAPKIYNKKKDQQLFSQYSRNETYGSAYGSQYDGGLSGVHNTTVRADGQVTGGINANIPAAGIPNTGYMNPIMPESTMMEQNPGNMFPGMQNGSYTDGGLTPEQRAEAEALDAMEAARQARIEQMIQPEPQVGQQMPGQGQMNQQQMYQPQMGQQMPGQGQMNQQMYQPQMGQQMPGQGQMNQQQMYQEQMNQQQMYQGQMNQPQMSGQGQINQQMNQAQMPDQGRVNQQMYQQQMYQAQMGQQVPGHGQINQQMYQAQMPGQQMQEQMYEQSRMQPQQSRNQVDDDRYKYYYPETAGADNSKSIYQPHTAAEQKAQDVRKQNADNNVNTTFLEYQAAMDKSMRNSDKKASDAPVMRSRYAKASYGNDPYGGNSIDPFDETPGVLRQEMYSKPAEEPRKEPEHVVPEYNADPFDSQGLNSQSMSSQDYGMQGMNNSQSMSSQSMSNQAYSMQGMNNSQSMGSQGVSSQDYSMQGMNNSQGMSNQGMSSRDYGMQGMNNSQSMSNQSVSSQDYGMQGMNNSQGMSNQGVSNQSMNSQGVNNQETDSQNLGSAQRYNSQDIDSQNEDYIRKQILSGQPRITEPMEYAVPPQMQQETQDYRPDSAVSKYDVPYEKIVPKSVAPAKPKIEVAEGEIACPQCGNICARGEKFCMVCGSRISFK